MTETTLACRRGLRQIAGMAGVRLDQLVVQQGLAESREKAQRLIMAGKVRVTGQVQTKAGKTFPADAVLELEQPERFVSRGGEKLEGAFVTFGIDVTGKVCADMGASTGGFTDCLLQHGAARVYALDVGKGQLHWKLRSDARVVTIDEINVRHLDPALIPEKVSFVCVDVSFISLTLILPAVINVLAPDAELVTLIKPQFEAGRGQVGAGGVVRDEAVRNAVVEKIRLFGTEQLGLDWAGLCESPIKGPAGNTEFLAWWRTTAATKRKL